MATVGTVLSTVITLLGPAELESLDCASVAVPLARLKVTVPLPEQLCRVIVRPDRPEPLYPKLQPAVPVMVIVAFAKKGALAKILAALA